MSQFLKCGCGIRDGGLIKQCEEHEGQGTHVLKSWPQYFQPSKNGDKNFDIRNNDRNFHALDLLVQCEFDPKLGIYTDAAPFMQEVLSVFPHIPHVKDGYVVMDVELV